MRSPLRPLVAAIGLSLLVAGCTGSSSDEEPFVESTAPVVQLGAPGQPNRTLSPEEQQSVTLPGHTEADVTFARGMMEHHAQALVMTAYVPDRTDNESLQLMAERMNVGQEQEIELLETWLTDMGESPRDLNSSGHGHGADGEAMYGMLTDAELAQLEAAEGEEFERLFLTLMIRHHEGAIDMVMKMIDDGGSLESRIDQFGREVISDQSIEIDRMQQMLAELEAR